MCPGLDVRLEGSRKQGGRQGRTAEPRELEPSLVSGSFWLVSWAVEKRALQAGSSAQGQMVRGFWGSGCSGPQAYLEVGGSLKSGPPLPFLQGPAQKGGRLQSLSEDPGASSSGHKSLLPACLFPTCQRMAAFL